MNAHDISTLLAKHLIKQGYSASYVNDRLSVNNVHVYVTCSPKTVRLSTLKFATNAGLYRASATKHQETGGYDIPAMAARLYLAATAHKAEHMAAQKAYRAFNAELKRLNTLIREDATGCHMRVVDEPLGLNVTLENLSVEQALAVLAAAGKLK